MKRVNKTARTLVLAVMICMMFICTVSAAESGSLWMSVSKSSNDTVAVIATDATVTDGLVELHYNSDKLTFKGVETNDASVALYAVNTDTKGVVKISWVAPKDFQSNGTGTLLIRVNFSGTEKESTLKLTGTANTATGSALPISKSVNTDGLEKAVLEADALKKDLYTTESYASMTDALAKAMAVLANDAASQKEVDEAEKLLRNAMDALVLKQTNPDSEADTTELEKAIAKAEGLNAKNYTQKSFAALQKALKAAKEVLANAKSSQKAVDDAAKALNDAIAGLVLANTSTPDTGDDSSMIMFVALAAAAAIGIVVVLVMMNKKKGEDDK